MRPDETPFACTRPDALDDAIADLERLHLRTNGSDFANRFMARPRDERVVGRVRAPAAVDRGCPIANLSWAKELDHGRQLQLQIDIYDRDSYS